MFNLLDTRMYKSDIFTAKICMISSPLEAIHQV